MRSQRDARVHGVLRHAVALPALVVRQVVREAEDALRSRRQRAAVRDGDQLESRDRLPDARQLAAAADPDDRARVRAQRLLQKQFHVQVGDARRTDHREFQGGGDARAALRRGSVDRRREGRAHPRRGACAVMAVPAQPCDQEALAVRADGSRRRYRAGTARSVSENPRAQDHRGSRLPQGPARTRRRPPALHSRSQPVPRRLRKRPAHHRRSRKPSTSSR